MHIQRSTYTLITQYTQISVNYNIIYFGYYSLLTMNVLKFNLSHPFYHRQGYINAYIRRVIPNLAYKTTGDLSCLDCVVSGHNPNTSGAC